MNQIKMNADKPTFREMIWLRQTNFIYLFVFVFIILSLISTSSIAQQKTFNATTGLEFETKHRAYCESQVISLERDLLRKHPEIEKYLELKKEAETIKAQAHSKNIWRYAFNYNFISSLRDSAFRINANLRSNSRSLPIRKTEEAFRNSAKFALENTGQTFPDSRTTVSIPNSDPTLLLEESKKVNFDQSEQAVINLFAAHLRSQFELNEDVKEALSQVVEDNKNDILLNLKVLAYLNHLWPRSQTIQESYSKIRQQYLEKKKHLLSKLSKDILKDPKVADFFIDCFKYSLFGSSFEVTWMIKNSDLQTIKNWAEVAFGIEIKTSEANDIDSVRAFAVGITKVPRVLFPSHPFSALKGTTIGFLLTKRDLDVDLGKERDPFGFYFPGSNQIQLFAVDSFDLTSLSWTISHELGHAIDSKRPNSNRFSMKGLKSSKPEFSEVFKSKGKKIKRPHWIESFDRESRGRMKEKEIYVPRSLRGFYYSRYAAFGGPVEHYAEAVKAFWVDPFFKCYAPIQYKTIKEEVFAGIDFFPNTDCSSKDAKKEVSKRLQDIQQLYGTYPIGFRKEIDSRYLNLIWMSYILYEQGEGSYQILKMSINGKKISGRIKLGPRNDQVSFSNGTKIKDISWGVVHWTGRFALFFTFTDGKKYRIDAEVAKYSFLGTDLTIDGKIYLGMSEKIVGDFKITD